MKNQKSILEGIDPRWEDTIAAVSSFNGSLDEFIATETQAAYDLGTWLLKEKTHLLSEASLAIVICNCEYLLLSVPHSRMTQDLLLKVIRNNYDADRYIKKQYWTELVAKEIVSQESSKLRDIPEHVRTISVISKALERSAGKAFWHMTDKERQKFGVTVLNGSEPCFSEFPKLDGYNYFMLVDPVTKKRYAIMDKIGHGEIFYDTIKP